MTQPVRTIGEAVKTTWLMLRRYLDQAEGPRRFDDLTGNGSRVIVFIAEHPGVVYQRAFEAHFAIRRSTATRMLQLMEDKGLIIRMQAAHDARQRVLQLTPRAWAIYNDIVDDVHKLERTILQGFTPQETETLFALLAKLQGNLSENSTEKGDIE